MGKKCFKEWIKKPANAEEEVSNVKEISRKKTEKKWEGGINK